MQARSRPGSGSESGSAPGDGSPSQGSILAVNAGSSSLKFALYPIHGDAVGPAWLSGAAQGLEPGGEATLSWRSPSQEGHSTLPSGEAGFAAALQALAQVIAGHEGAQLLAVAHRVVHGGLHYTQATRITSQVLSELEALQTLAPLHQPHNLAGIRHCQEAFAALPQVACFDTAFHAQLDPLEQAFALPQALTAQGLRRYGFHGLSYDWVSRQLQTHSARAQNPKCRVLMAHLGNGASLCAWQGGRSRATSMGFSALDGLMMGTRSGSLDPGVLLHLLRQGQTLAQLQHLLYSESGLLGVSGLSADMRTLRQAAPQHRRAQQAIDLFTHRIVREGAALMAVMQGMDVLVFTGGIGEHDAQLREDVCAQWQWLGVRLDSARNRSIEGQGKQPLALHAQDSAVEVWCIPTDEGRRAAEQTWALLQAST